MKSVMGKTLDPAHNTQKAKSINFSPNFNVTEEERKLQRHLKIDIIHADLLRYLPGMLPLAYQGMIFNVKTIKKSADPTFKDIWTLEINLILPEGGQFGPNLSTFVNIS